MWKPVFAYAKTKAQISCAVTDAICCQLLTRTLIFDAVQFCFDGDSLYISLFNIYTNIP